MAIKVTRIGDVFKQKVRDTEFNAYAAPTLWVEYDTGIEHEDYEHTYIESRDRSNSYIWHGDKNDTSYVGTLDFVRVGDNLLFPDSPCLFVDGYIKQIGSHVIYCGPLCDSPMQSYPCLDDLTAVFKYARKLEYIYKLFNNKKNISPDYDVPEDLFWNCPNLKVVMQFIYQITKIPEGLFSRCPELESVRSAFFNTKITEIPAGLFKNNPKIKDFSGAFLLSKVTEIPDNLFSAVRDRLINGDVNVSGFAYYTPLSNKFLNVKGTPKTEEEREAKRNEYLPSDLPREVQWKLITELDSVPPRTF